MKKYLKTNDKSVKRVPENIGILKDTFKLGYTHIITLIKYKTKKAYV
jgi:hypothetical protein